MWCFILRKAVKTAMLEISLIVTRVSEVWLYSTLLDSSFRADDIQLVARPAARQRHVRFGPNCHQECERSTCDSLPVKTSSKTRRGEVGTKSGVENRSCFGVRGCRTGWPKHQAKRVHLTVTEEWCSPPPRASVFRGGF